MEGQPSTVRTAAGILVAVVGFLFGIRLVGTATGAPTQTLEPPMEYAINGNASALGVSWL